MSIVNVGLGPQASRVNNEVLKVQKKLEVDVMKTGCTSADSVLEDLRRGLESVDYPRTINFLCDMSGSYGLASTVLETMAFEWPGVNTHAILVNLTGTEGPSVFNATLTVQSALSVCDSVIIRDVAEAKCFLDVEYASLATGYGLSDLTRYIAADLVVALGCNNDELLDVEHVMYPHSVCSTRRKLIDVRSSLYKVLRRVTEQERDPKLKNQKYSPLRALATNLHALHQSTPFSTNLKYQNTSKSSSSTATNKTFAAVLSTCLPEISTAARMMPGFTAAWSDLMTVSCASLLGARLDPSRRCVMTQPSTCTSADVAVAMKWATPHIMWPIDSMGALAVHRDVSTGLVVSSTPATSSSLGSSRMNSSMTSSRSSMSFSSSSSMMSTARTGKMATTSRSRSSKLSVVPEGLSEGSVSSRPGSGASSVFGLGDDGYDYLTGPVGLNSFNDADSLCYSPSVSVSSRRSAGGTGDGNGVGSAKPSSQGLASSRLSSRGASSFSRPPSSASSVVSASSSSPHQSDAAAGGDPDEVGGGGSDRSIAVLSFTSPYAVSYISSLSERAADFLSTGAYTHRLDGRECDILDSIIETAEVLITPPLLRNHLIPIGHTYCISIRVE